MTLEQLNEMSLDELQVLQKNVETAIETHESRKISEARAKIQEIAKELGVSMNQIFGVNSAKKRNSTIKKTVGVSGPVKYRHPDTPELTWTGRGRRPNWIIEHEGAGGSREDFRVI